MKRNIILLITILISINACKDNITDPSIDPPVEVKEMMGTWNFNANFSFNGTYYSFDITNAKIYVGNLLNSEWPFDFEATMRDLQLVCKKNDKVEWTVSLENLNIEVSRAIIILVINFSVPTPFGDLLFDCESGWNQDEIERDSWKGEVFVDVPSTEILVDGVGNWKTERIE